MTEPRGCREAPSRPQLWGRGGSASLTMPTFTITDTCSGQQKATGAGKGASKSHRQEVSSEADSDRDGAFWSTCTVCFNCPPNWSHAFQGLSAGLIYCGKDLFLGGWGGGEGERHKQTVLENRVTYNRSEKGKGNRAGFQMGWGGRNWQRGANAEQRGVAQKGRKSGLKSHLEETMISLSGLLNRAQGNHRLQGVCRFGSRKLCTQYPGEIRRVGA